MLLMVAVMWAWNRVLSAVLNVVVLKDCLYRSTIAFTDCCICDILPIISLNFLILLLHAFVLYLLM